MKATKEEGGYIKGYSTVRQTSTCYGNVLIVNGNMHNSTGYC